MASPINTDLIYIVAAIFFGLILFIYIIFQQKKLTRYWIMLHCLAVIINVVAMISTSANMFVFGRTESECAVLHRIGGTTFYSVQAMMRMYFAARITMLHTMESKFSQAIDYSILFLACIYLPISTIWFNISLQIFIVPVIELCVFIPNNNVHNWTTVLRFIIDISINCRFLKYIMTRHRTPATKFTSAPSYRENKRRSTTTPSPTTTTGHGRLINITMAFFLIQTVFEVITTLMVAGMTPIVVDQYVFVYIIEMAFNSASTIWPMILVHFLKKTTTFNALRTVASRAVRV